MTSWPTDPNSHGFEDGVASNADQFGDHIGHRSWADVSDGDDEDRGGVSEHELDNRNMSCTHNHSNSNSKTEVAGGTGGLPETIENIHDKALNDPHDAPLYANVVRHLVAGNCGPLIKHQLLNQCLAKFENLAAAREKRMQRANVIFIGNLFLRGLLAKNIIEHIVRSLIFLDFPPHSDQMESAVALLQVVGFKFEEQEGEELMSDFVAKLESLMSFHSSDIKAKVKGLTQLRARGWMQTLHNGLAPCASDSQRLSGTAVAAKTTLSLDDANIRLIANQKEKLRNCKNKISDNPTASEYTTQALRLLVVAEKLFTTMSQVQVQVLHQYEDNNTCQAVQHLQEMAQGQLRQEGLSKGKVHRERTAFCSCEDGGADI